LTVLFTDITSIVLLIMVVLMLDVFAFIKHELLYIGAAVVAFYGATSVANNGYVITSTVYDPNTATFINNQTDPNIFLVVFGLLSLFSFAMYALEKANLL